MNKLNLLKTIDNIISYCNENKIKTPTLLLNTKSYLDNEIFKVGVIGKIKSGKSTLLNCLIGKEILPTKVTVSTAAVSVIESSNTPSIEYEDIEGNRIFDKEFSIEKVKNLISTKDRREDERISKVHIKYPIQFSSNVILIDTPGLDDTSEWRVDKTLSVLNEIDIALVLIKYPLSRSILDFLKEKIVQDKSKKLFFCLTFIDYYDDKKELQKCLSDISYKLEKVLNYKPTIYPISPKLALKAFTESNKKPQELIKLEKSIIQFLDSSESRKLKLTRAANNIIFALNDIKGQLLMKKQLLPKNLDDLNNELNSKETLINNYDKNLLELKEYVTNKFNLLIEKIESQLDELKKDLINDVQMAIDGFVQSELSVLTASIIPQIIKRKLKEWEFKNESIIKQFTQGIIQFITQKIREINKEYNSLVLNLDENLRTDLTLFTEEVKVPDTVMKNADLDKFLLGAGAFLGLLTQQIYLFFVPFIADRLIGISKKLQGHKKNYIKPLIIEKVQWAVHKFKEEKLNGIYNVKSKLLEFISESYEEKINNLKHTIDDIKDLKQAKNEIINSEIEKIDEILQQLNSFENDIMKHS